MKNFTKLISCAALLFLTNLKINAQNGTIKGNITDKSGKIVEFATVTVLQTKDSSLVKGAIADINGKFEIENIKAGNYLLGITQIGFEKYYSPTFNITSEIPSINFKEIIIKETTKKLNEVEVKAQKLLIEQKIDRTVVNVDNSIVAAGNTALEVLEKAPGVSVDQDGKISLKGKQAVLIYIDDKPTYMSSSDLANLLRNMQASQVEKIELITTPPAKYDAAGNAGIINLKLKRNENMGLNGSVNGGLGYGIDTKLPKYNGGINLNYRKGKWNLYGNANKNYRKSYRSQKISRNFYEGDTKISSFNQLALNDQKSEFLGYKLGVDFFATKKTTIGILVNNNSGDWGQPKGINTAQILSRNGTLDSTSITKNMEIRDWANYSANLNIKHSFDSTGKEITSDIDFAQYINDHDQQFRTNKYVKDDLNNSKFIRNENGLSKSTINILSAKVDYVLPLVKAKAKIEIGLKTSYVNSENDMKFWFLDNFENNPKIDPLRTRDFEYLENINAGYINYSKDFKALSVQLGLRAENTIGQGTLLGRELLNRNYTNVFPTAYFRKTLNKKNSMGLSLARRIDRPSYEDLNPFLFFLDPYTFQRGNELLTPEYTNSLELSHTFMDAITTTLNYSKTKDKMSEAFEQNNELKTTNVTKYNIGEVTNIGVSISAPTPIKKWWSGNVFLNVYQNQYQANIPRNTFNGNGEIISTIYQPLDVKAVSFEGNIQQNIALPKDFSLEISGWYRSPGIESQLRMNSMATVNIGLRKKMLKGKGNLSLNINDVFWTQYFTGDVKFNDIDVKVESRWESRVARLNFSYRFGNTKVQAERRRETGLESEKARVKSGSN
jgi:iron complex outermembrane recepter protein